MRIQEADGYKNFVLWTFSQMPNGGRGEFQGLAKHLRVHSTLVSQVLRGDKDLTLEQGLGTADYLALGHEDKHFFMLLLQKDRAGTKDLKDYYAALIKQERDHDMKVAARLKGRATIDPSAQAQYYSEWTYTAVWLATMLPGHGTAEAISKRTRINPQEVSNILEFLSGCGLCVEKNGKYIPGLARTHLDSSSPLVRRHHANWRLKAIEHLPELSTEELAFTAPISLSRKDLGTLRAKILDLIEEAGKIVESSPEEELACLNIDLFRL